MKRVKTLLLILLLLRPASLLADNGFDFDDLDTVEATEQQQLLQMAKEAAQTYNFPKTQSLIEQAENKSYGPNEIISAKQALASAKRIRGQNYLFNFGIIQALSLRCGYPVSELLPREIGRYRSAALSGVYL